MDLKKMGIEYINSPEVEKKLAEKMDKAINIPFVKDEKEAKFFREVADIMTDIMGVILDQLANKLEKK
jgi:hypothetical protein|tara:strand:- start:1648 stop:1851 length:204 start_codon:yes stop_codon:yes gene_type:complete